MQTRFYQQGLTLLELIISLVIVSIVIALCANGFVFGSRVWAKVDQKQGHLDEIISAQRFIRKSLTEAIHYPQDEEISKDNFFRGNSDKIIFMAPSPQYGLDDYLYIYELFKQKIGEGRYNLGLRYIPANSYFYGTVRAADKEIILFKNFKRIKFQYYGFNSLTGEQAWYDSWDGQNTLPLLVSISAESIDSSKQWPTLIVETKFGGYVLP